MDTLSFENGKLVKSHSKLGVVSLMLSIIAFLMSLQSIFYPYTSYFHNGVIKKFLSLFGWTQQHNILFNILGIVQILLIIGACIISLFDLNKKGGKKIFSIISIILIGIIMFGTMKTFKL